MQPSNRRQSLSNLAKRAGVGIIMGFAIAINLPQLLWLALAWANLWPRIGLLDLNQILFWITWLASIAVAIHAPTTNKALVRLVILLGIGVSWHIIFTIVYGAALVFGIYSE